MYYIVRETLIDVWTPLIRLYGHVMWSQNHSHDERNAKDQFNSSAYLIYLNSDSLHESFIATELTIITTTEICIHGAIQYKKCNSSW